MTKFDECLFQASDAIEEAKKWAAAGDDKEVISQLRRAERELNAALVTLSKASAA